MQLKTELNNSNSNLDYQSLLIELGVPKHLLALGSLDFELLYERLRFAMSKIHLKQPLECTEYWQLETLGRPDFNIDWLKDMDHLRDNKGASPFHYIAWSGNFKKLLKMKATFPSCFALEDNNGRTPLHYAAISGNTKILEWIIDNYANILLQMDKDGFTLIHFATSSGNVKILTCLNDKRSDFLTLKDKFGSTPIHLAVRAGNLKTWLWANTNIPNISELKNNNGLTPLHFALMSGNLNILKLIKKKELLLQDNLGRTPIHYAALSGNPEILDYIKSKISESFEIKDKNGATPIHYTCLSGNLTALKWITNNYPEAFEPSDEEIKHPLFYVTLSDNPEALSQIISRKMISLKGFNNFSPEDRKIISKNLIQALETNYHLIHIDLNNCEMLKEDKEIIHNILLRNSNISLAKASFIYFLQGLKQSNSSVSLLNLGEGICQHILKHLLPENVNVEQINQELQSIIDVKTSILDRIKQELMHSDPKGKKKAALQNLCDLIQGSKNLSLDLANWEQANAEIISKRYISVDSCLFKSKLINIKKVLTDIKFILGQNSDKELLETNDKAHKA